jgi:hypothetical protein
MPSKTHSPATYPLFNVSMCRKPHSRSHKFPLFNVSANPLAGTLRKRGKCLGRCRGRHIDTLERPREPEKKADGEKRQSVRPLAMVLTTLSDAN